MGRGVAASTNHGNGADPVEPTRTALGQLRSRPYELVPRMMMEFVAVEANEGAEAGPLVRDAG